MLRPYTSDSKGADVGDPQSEAGRQRLLDREVPLLDEGIPRFGSIPVSASAPSVPCARNGCGK